MGHGQDAVSRLYAKDIAIIVNERELCRNGRLSFACSNMGRPCADLIGLPQVTDLAF
jgi:hypothetical protein